MLTLLGTQPDRLEMAGRKDMGADIAKVAGGTVADQSSRSAARDMIDVITRLRGNFIGAVDHAHQQERFAARGPVIETINEPF